MNVTMNRTESRGDSFVPRPRRSIKVRHSSLSPARKGLVIKPCSSNKINTAFVALGGVNVPTERRASKSRGLFLAETEESLHEQELVNDNDPFAPKSVDDREARAWECAPYEDDDEESRVAVNLKEFGLAACVLFVNDIPSERVLAAAKVAVKNPKVLASLYRAAMRLEGVENDRGTARMKIFEFLQRVVSAMLTLATPEEITASLADQVDVEDGKDYRDPATRRTQKTLLARFASWARNEMRNNGYGHYSAARILKELGYNNVFASCLD
jgi:hypothetical protein